jgi:hypothetical protein
MCILAETNGLLNAKATSSTSSSKHFGVSSSLEPLSSICNRTLCSAIKWQCQLIDQSILLAMLDCGSEGLLEHISCFNDLFLVSPTSDFLPVFSNLLIERHLSLFPLGSDDKMKNTGRGFDSNVLRSPLLWCAGDVSIAFIQTGKSASFSNKSFFKLASFAIQSKIGESPKNQQQTVPSAFSCSGLEDLLVSYEAPWPVSVLFTKEVCIATSYSTRRLLELHQTIALLRILWTDIRLWIKRGDQGAEEDRKRRRANERLLLSAYQIVQHIVHAVFAFTADRIHIMQQKMRQDFIICSKNGVGGVASAVRNNIQCLATSLFTYYSSRHMTIYSHSEHEIVIALDNILNTSRRMLYDMYNGIVDSSQLSNRRLSLAVVKLAERRSGLVESLKSVEGDTARTNAQTLLLYLGNIN